VTLLELVLLLEPVLLELALPELFALRPLLDRPAADVAGAPEEGPAALSLELFVVDVAPVVPFADVAAVVVDVVFPFCAHGGRFGSSCARMGSIAADTSRNAPSSARQWNSR